jgi:hypothetical protein
MTESAANRERPSSGRSSHGHEPGDHLVIRDSCPGIEHDGAVEHLGGQIAQRRELGARQSRAPKVLVGQREDRLRPERSWDEGSHPPVDRLRGPARELLEDDGPHERAVRPVGVAWSVPDRADRVDQASEHRVDGGHHRDPALQ